MSERIKEEAKKVNISELFYDLVFVYGVSRITHIFHGLNEGIISGHEILLYVVVFICFLSVWNIQTVYMNRYGKHDLYHMFIMCVLQMPALLFMAANVSVELDKTWLRFSLALLWLAFVQLLQYVYAYVMHKDNVDNKKLITNFIKLLLGRIVAILLSLLFTGNLSIILTGIGVSLSIMSTKMFEKDIRKVPVNMPHLIERLTLLTIITLGEMIVATGEYFEVENFSIYSVLLLIQIVGLFLFYIVEFDHIIDENLPAQSGAGLIYNHYFVWFGLNLCTIDFDYANDKLGTALIVIMFLGYLLFYFGVLNSLRYNKKGHILDKIFIIPLVAVYLIGFGLSYYFRESAKLLTVICTLVVVLEAAIFIYSNIVSLSKEVEIKNKI
jgi:bacterial low temperature requirement A protein (ltrA)